MQAPVLPIKETVRRKVGKVIVLLFGALLYAVSVALLFQPADLVTGGLTGIAMVANKLIHVPIGLTIFVLNIPLFLLGMRRIGRPFLILSLLAMGFSSAAIDIIPLFKFEIVAIAEDRLLASVLAGTLSGAGLGLVMTAGGSTGGTDILGLLIRQKTESVSIGRIILISDLVIVAANTLIFHDLTAALYTAIAAYLSGAAIDSVLYGANVAAVTWIITQNPEEISKLLLYQLERGVTMLNGTGGYSGAPQSVLICAVGRRQIGQLRQLVKSVDENAFVIVSEAKEIAGNGFPKADIS